MSESEWWWAWSGAAGGAWAAVVCVVVVLGSAMNVAVVIHWLTCRSSRESPSAALPCVDLLMCAVAAPLRYAHAPPFPTPAISRLVAEVTPAAPINVSAGTSHVRWGVVDNTNSTAGWVVAPSDAPRQGASGAHAVVVCMCLASLHVVFLVALHRLAMLLRSSSSSSSSSTSACVRTSSRFAFLLVVLISALAAAAVLVGSLHATGRFTDSLPLLGVSTPRAPGAPPPPLVVGFLAYVVALCGAASLCYLIIVAAILRQGHSRSSAAPLPQSPSPSHSSTSGALTLTAEPACLSQNYGGRERSVRACLTVLSVLVTLAVCWEVPVCLALYALLTEASLTPSLPYSDALLLLSGLVHPFVYGEGWAAVAACVSGARQGALVAAFRVGLLAPLRTPARQRVEGAVHWCTARCCCRHGRRPCAEDTSFNSFPLRHPTHLQMDYI